MRVSSDTSAFSKPRPGLTALANPTRFLAFTKIVMPWLTAATVITLAIGLFMSFNVPDDYQQGRTVRIMFVHVPSVWVAMAAYMTMVSGALGVLVWRHPLADVAARAAAPIGATFTFLGLATGSIWGRPMWGTWWAWDPRLTSFLILFLFYLGYIALWAAIENDETAADLTAMLCLVGSVFALLSRYAVNFWNQGLHQGASLSLDKEENVADVFYFPLLVCIAGFVLLFIALVLMRTRTEIRARRIKAMLARERRA